MNTGVRSALSLILSAVVSCLTWGIPNQANASFYPRGARSAGSLYVKAVASTTTSSCAIKSDGTLWCWGDNSSGQLGNGTFIDSSIPVQVTALSNVIEVVAGGFHVCALTADRSLYCWGDNAYGRVGIGILGGKYSSPQLISFPGGLKPLRVAASIFSTCALLEDATVRCWGGNIFGELGDGTALGTNRLSPSATSIALTGVTELKGGYINFCAITVVGDVHCWASNFLGQIGIGLNGGNYNTPQKVDLFSLRSEEGAGESFLTTVHPVGLTVGAYAVCANTDNGKVYCWGGNGYGQLGTGNTTDYNRPELASALSAYIVDQVELGFEFGCILTRGGAVRCWGNNAARYNPATTANSLTPVLLSGAGNSKVISVANSGDETSIGGGPWMLQDGGVFAVQNSGALQSWGMNHRGQLGRGLVSTFESFGQTVGMSAGSISDLNPMGSGINHACFVDHRSRLKCMGNNTFGQLGNGGVVSSSTPVSVTGFSGNALMITSGNPSNHNCAVKAGNTVQCWGRNTNAQVDSSLLNRTSPVTVPSISDAISVAVGDQHSCVLRKAGTIYCWGLNNQGQIGNGVTLPGPVVTTPSAVINLNLAFPYPVQVAAGSSHTCALDAAGKVRCWGSNSSGQLGDATTISKSTPVFVKTSAGVSLASIVAIAAGGNTTCALSASGEIYCWGANDYRQFGNAVTSASLNVAQTAVNLPARATHFALGQRHGCAGLVNGKTYCWGDNAGGKGSIGSLASPINPPALAMHSATVGDDVVSTGVQGGGVSSYFITRKAAPAQSCGFNSQGNLGDGTTFQRSYAGQIINFL